MASIGFIIRLTKNEFKSATEQSRIAEVRAGEWIAKIIRKAFVKDILHVEMQVE